MSFQRLTRALARQHTAEWQWQPDASIRLLHTHAEACSSSSSKGHQSPMLPLPDPAPMSGLWYFSDALSYVETNSSSSRMSTLSAPALTSLKAFHTSRCLSATVNSSAAQVRDCGVQQEAPECLRRSTHDVPRTSAAQILAASTQGPTGQSMDPQEVLKFEAMAAEWWDPEGSSGALHTMNPLRTQFARDAVCLAHG